MKYEIKSRFSGNVLFAWECDSFKICVEAMVKSGAYLHGADLHGADLQGAYLHGANLRGADLRGASGINPYRSALLMMLLDQPGEICLYKIVNQNHEGIFNGGLKYRTGEKISVDDADTDINRSCGKGINVATLDWCLMNYQDGCKILKVYFTAGDIACIPLATDGKIRLHRCRVGEAVDYAEIGLRTAV